MLTKNQEKLIRSLHTKKGRLTANQCLVEGQKVIDTAGAAVDFTFSSADTENFADLVTTETPQDIAAVANTPRWKMDTIASYPTIVLLDGVQDPGNVGTILRLCLGFKAALILVDSVDVTNPKVVRSSVGALFHVPWQVVKRSELETYLSTLGKRSMIRLEHTALAVPLEAVSFKMPCIIIAGSEGKGITVPLNGQSVYIAHEAALESLNVATALAITLSHLYNGS